MNKKGADLTLIIVSLVVAVAIAFIVIGFNQGSIGKASALLGANDAVVVAAAAGCSSDLSFGPVDLQKKFCYEFKTIEKKSFLGISTQLVNCDYLNNTIKTTISNVDVYRDINCSETVWVEQCQLKINENADSSDYSVLINGKECNKKNLILMKDIWSVNNSCFNKTNNGCVSYAGADKKAELCIASSVVYLSDQDCRIALASRK